MSHHRALVLFLLVLGFQPGASPWFVEVRTEA